MLEQMSWEDVYELWKRGQYHFPETLSEAISSETVFVPYKGDGYFYGYDWLGNRAAMRRKELIKKNPATFLYLTEPSNKGTIQTAEMLMEAQDEEERAAIWIAATGFEMKEFEMTRGSALQQLRGAAEMFLRERFYMWHHAMRRLVPEIMIPYQVMENVLCKDADTLIGLIQTNTMLLRGTHSILCYSSLKEGEVPEHRSARIKPL